MGDGVMDVQHIQIVILRDLRHPRRERQAVGRILEQRVIRYFHFVIEDARGSWIQADRIRVSDEMDVMAAGGQLQAKLGGNDSAASIGRITGDADLHAELDCNGLSRDSSFLFPESAWLHRFGRGCSDRAAQHRRRRTKHALHRDPATRKDHKALSNPKAGLRRKHPTASPT